MWCLLMLIFLLTFAHLNHGGTSYKGASAECNRAIRRCYRPSVLGRNVDGKFSDEAFCSFVGSTNQCAVELERNGTCFNPQDPNYKLLTEAIMPCQVNSCKEMGFPVWTECPTGFAHDPVTGKCYTLVDTPLSYPDAADYCKTNFPGGEFVSNPNADHIQQLLYENFLPELRASCGNNEHWQELMREPPEIITPLFWTSNPIDATDCTENNDAFFEAVRWDETVGRYIDRYFNRYFALKMARIDVNSGPSPSFWISWSEEQGYIQACDPLIIFLPDTVQHCHVCSVDIGLPPSTQPPSTSPSTPPTSTSPSTQPTSTSPSTQPPSTNPNTFPPSTSN